MRAASIDPDAASLVGIDLKHTYAVVLGIATAVAAIGGTLIALTFAVSPTSGTSWLLRAFTLAAYVIPVVVAIALLAFADAMKLSLVDQLTSLLLLAILAITLVMQRPLGLRLLALRDNEDGAISVGVRRLRTLMPTWAISAFLTGLMGAVVALQKGQLTPTGAFSIQYALDTVVICVIGGLGTLYGPLIGAVVVFVLRQNTAELSSWATLIEAIIVILVVRFFPDGVMGIVDRVRDAIVAAAGRRGRLSTAETE